ncbi:MAG: hypothetical protein JSR00_01765 [Bacteroidetes bacterium]|nr:hypothetical protein [Bacteroidota bacterium]
MLIVFQVKVKGQTDKAFQIKSLQTSESFISQSKNADVNVLGMWHNECLDFTLNKLISNGIGATDSRYSILSTQITQEFMKKKGIETSLYFSGDFKQWYLEQPETICDKRSDISSDCAKLICEIQMNIDNFRDEKISLIELASQRNSIISNGKSLKNKDEVFLVGLTASITKNSYEYWNENYESMYSRISALNKVEQSGKGPSLNEIYEQPLKIRWWAVGLSDAWGAFNWGRGGLAIGGPQGAVAAGLVGACYQSATSIYTQTVIQTIMN